MLLILVRWHDQMRSVSTPFILCAWMKYGLLFPNQNDLDLNKESGPDGPCHWLFQRLFIPGRPVPPAVHYQDSRSIAQQLHRSIRDGASSRSISLLLVVILVDLSFPQHQYGTLILVSWALHPGSELKFMNHFKSRDSFLSAVHVALIATSFLRDKAKRAIAASTTIACHFMSCWRWNRDWNAELRMRKRSLAVSLRELVNSTTRSPISRNLDTKEKESPLRYLYSPHWSLLDRCSADHVD